ncbi:MAG: hypothetical protein HUU50_06180 [Candidatus Brocadiae bacterium]|nr:hypothetical protein [Candidatus Brocadiia bacterium]
MPKKAQTKSGEKSQEALFSEPLSHTQAGSSMQPQVPVATPQPMPYLGSQPQMPVHPPSSHYAQPPIPNPVTPGAPASHISQQPLFPPYTAVPYQQMMAAQWQSQMMQMMQIMGSQIGIPGMDPVAQPFHHTEAPEEKDPGLDADIIRPHQMRSVVKTQQPLPVHDILDCLCLTEDGKYSLGGIPKGCTIAFAGPPGKGKTRTAISALCKVAYSGMRCAFVVAEEGFLDEKESGRDDLCSRLTKIGMKALSLSEAQFQKKIARNIAVIQSQYHKGHTWDSFVSRYRFLVEKEGIQFVIIDSLNTLDPTKTKTADNLSALKTYNHEKGVTCLTIGQIKDTGGPVGGEALIHTADAVFMLEQMSLGSKEIAEFWGGQYRDSITVLKAIKSVTTPIFPYPIRVTNDETVGSLKVHPLQPKEYQFFPAKPQEEKTAE